MQGKCNFDAKITFKFDISVRNEVVICWNKNALKSSNCPDGDLLYVFPSSFHNQPSKNNQTVVPIFI